jgi:nucleotide-binding universal stress UspA family protein
VTGTYRHILVATDGSPLSQAAVRSAVRLARSLGARMSAIYVARPFHPLAWEVEALVDTRGEYERYQKRQGRRALEACEALAQRAGLRCNPIFVTAERPYEAILVAARKHRCDLIVVASHGRQGVSRLILGSETQKLLAHSRVPVLVCR